MGRRGVRLEDEGRWVFNRLAVHYRARPPYPEALVDRLVELAGDGGARVADLGAGAGHLALPLCARGLRVAAVDPARAMLAVLAEGRAALPDGTSLEIVHATAEASGLPEHAFALVVLADAAQWVDPELSGAEAARLLAPGGVLAVVETSFARTPFMDGLSALLSSANPRARPRPPGAVRQLLALAAGSAPAREERYRQEATLGEESLAALLRSLSYAGPALGPSALSRVVAQATSLALGEGGATFARDLTLRWTRRTAGQASRRPAGPA